jgi:hypothetical protein
MQHEGGWENCNQISNTVRKNIGKLVKAGVFESASTSSGTASSAGAGQPSKQKRGTANAVVEEEDDGEETDVEEDGMPTREHLLQMLGMSNTLIGNVNNVEEPTAKAEGCWDGDTLSHLGFTNIQVGGAGRDADHEVKTQGVSFAEAEWKVQGVRGTNPLKVKRKTKTASMKSDVATPPATIVDEKPAFIKKCMKNLNVAVSLANASGRSAKATTEKPKEDRYTLDRWKLYLDSCATYHSFFAKEFLRNIEDGNTTLTGSCNAGTTVTSTRGRWGEFKA